MFHIFISFDLCWFIDIYCVRCGIPRLRLGIKNVVRNNKRCPVMAQVTRKDEQCLKWRKMFGIMRRKMPGISRLVILMTRCLSHWAPLPVTVSEAKGIVPRCNAIKISDFYIACKRKRRGSRHVHGVVCINDFEISAAERNRNLLALIAKAVQASRNRACACARATRESFSAAAFPNAHF